MRKVEIPFAALKAKASLRKNRKPRLMSFGHNINVAEKIADGGQEAEFPFRLLDYKNGNQKNKIEDDVSSGSLEKQ